MKTYNVTFIRYGFVTIEAENEEDAFQKVEGYGAEDINWSEQFEADAVEEDM